MKQKRNRKSLALLLAVIMLLSVLPMAGMAADDTPAEVDCLCSEDCTAAVHQEGCPFYPGSQSSAPKAADKLNAAGSPSETEQPKETEQPEETEQPKETEQP